MPAYQTDQLMLWRDGQSHAGGPNKKKKIPRDNFRNGLITLTTPVSVSARSPSSRVAHAARSPHVMETRLVTEGSVALT